MKKNWYAVYTKSRCEKRVSALLTKKKVENYCPLNRLTGSSTDRKKAVLEPLFPSYVFVHITEMEMTAIRQTSDVVNFVYWLGRPAVIKDVEIESIQHFVSEHTDVQLEKTAVNVSDMVRIVSGPSMEFEGNVVSIKNNKVKVTLPSLGVMMTADVQKSNVELLDYSYKLRNMVS
ncbi:MAG: UpxY family transcription antiterminator [Bacteroidetes bacterium]|jgi:transcription antitermination factor NusG|nr:UpxY family transcription antiterminator [Bacteroidota bacterium]